MDLNSTSGHALAIQGGLGSFHHIAARTFDRGKTAGVLPCADFHTVASLAAEKDGTAGVMAIENSVAGSLLHNYTLLDRFPLQIAGEVFLRIRQNLLALRGKKIEDLDEVHSHPMALAQCGHFLQAHPHLKLVESDDTAMSAEVIGQERLDRRAAIASTLAAELFELEVIASGIEDHPQNYTRFLLLHKHEAQAPALKASLSIVLDHSPGALHRLLRIADEGGLNLTKIQSMPIVGKPWHYRFYIDIEGTSPIDAPHLHRLLGHACQELLVHGVYSPGQHHEA